MITKRVFLWLLTILSLGLFQPSTALAEESQKLPSGTDRNQIGQKIQDFVKEHEKTTAGMEMSVFDTNGTIYRGNFGYIDKEKGVKADDDSVFEWGSVTKLTVWVSVMQLWEEGEIDLEEDIRTYLPKDFLKTLRFDKPITMLDLMNHQAGFEESSAAMNSDQKSMEELLATKQPAQIFEPGSKTAYSNYGTGLAAYIVERISKQSFSDYAHQHIFQPLGMDRTALLPDLSDNAYVRDKRKEGQAYNANGQAQGPSIFYLSLYPVGQATSTFEDFQKFAQALLKQDKLFQRPETWDTLYSASSTYPGTDLPLNMHGFWTVEYGTSVVGHGGNTDGFSSKILLDLKNGVGYAVMTNQAQELIYNETMPELIFGVKKKTDKSTFEAFQPGFYRRARYFATGPMSITRGFLYTSYASKGRDNSLLSQDYAVLSRKDGQEMVTAAYGDSYKITDMEAYMDYTMYLLFFIGLVYAFINLIISGAADLIRLVRKKTAKAPTDLKIWNYLTTLTILGAGFNSYLIFATMAVSKTAIMQPWRYMVFAGLGILLIASLVYPLITKIKNRLSRGRLALTILTSLSALAIVVNILYWSLYQWWVV
ncbi:serine hydrolase domain-containing protein [Streptococcus panodentis]|uniref:Methicillin resistance protein FmtA n=1 Tax=Streptococcus panodentis TaxID=1581472 RepID=A0ABS5AV32_9STRE|nr:serine hydrolase [Streptococcus panodentis]MBP2620118.1 methicillin resistance protein FmtA [Streptococcus panodentis]